MWPMKMLRSCIFLLWISGIACQVPQERQAVPVIGGISLGQAYDFMRWKQDSSLSKVYHLSAWMIEWPLILEDEAAHSKFNYYEPSVLDSLLPLLESASIPYYLAFSLPRIEENPFIQVALSKCFADISGILLRSASYPPAKVIFTGEFFQTPETSNALNDFVVQMGSEFTAFKGEIVYALALEAVDREFLDWSIPDVIGICYPPSASLNQRSLFYNQNRHWSRWLIEQDKPGLIVESNLLGAQKLERFTYQLRYWEEEVVLEGIVLNSLYSQLSLSDSNSYFALAIEDAFKNYLNEYQKYANP